MIDPQLHFGGFFVGVGFSVGPGSGSFLGGGFGFGRSEGGFSGGTSGVSSPGFFLDGGTDDIARLLSGVLGIGAKAILAEFDVQRNSIVGIKR
jgi:hypothetical protein